MSNYLTNAGRTPTDAEVAAYGELTYQILDVALDALKRGESPEVINQRPDATLAGLDWTSIQVVDKYLSEVEDGCAIRPMRYEVLGKALTRLFDQGAM